MGKESEILVGGGGYQVTGTCGGVILMILTFSKTKKQVSVNTETAVLIGLELENCCLVGVGDKNLVVVVGVYWGG